MRGISTCSDPQIIISTTKEVSTIIINDTLPFTAHFHRRRYVNSFYFGLPRVLADSAAGARTALGGRRRQGAVKILHSPSDPVIKGTAEIRRAIAGLQQAGHDIEFVELSGVTNAEVIEQILTCDFVIDQIYSDMPMATFALEAAYYGKPSVVCGYPATQLSGFSRWPIAPSRFVPPAGLEDAIEQLILDEPARLDLGRRAREFVRSQWSPPAVAERLLRLIRGEAPDEWWIEPEAVLYVQGCGLPEARCRQVVAQLIGKYGPAALRVGSRLEACFVDFAAAPGEARSAASGFPE